MAALGACDVAPDRRVAVKVRNSNASASGSRRLPFVCKIYAVPAGPLWGNGDVGWVWGGGRGVLGGGSFSWAGRRNRGDGRDGPGLEGTFEIGLYLPSKSAILDIWGSSAAVILPSIAEFRDSARAWKYIDSGYDFLMSRRGPPHPSLSGAKCDSGSNLGPIAVDVGRFRCLCRPSF